jgi:hypothetical protein
MAMMTAYFAERGIEAPADGHLYRIELDSVATVSIESDQLVIASWTPERGVVTVQR